MIINAGNGAPMYIGALLLSAPRSKAVRLAFVPLLCRCGVHPVAIALVDSVGGILDCLVNFALINQGAQLGHEIIDVAHGIVLR